ncbi:restriction endonuclease subunit S [uncultured Streptococcus sp.]|uniref:restriction endonuclease subunit S n=1 Tax=uncultured Streptococcus sp. TaxID=83427 RepID=UPI0025F68A97|nr:restriction endonuclease subunit S [uncultured Streptococcus sp.]
MKTKSKIPALRFKGFTDAWEQRKLGEVSKYSNGGSYENDVVENGTYELITLKSVNMSGKLVSSGKFINRETKTLEKDTLVMILSEQAPGLLGMTAKIPENNRYVLNQRVAEIKPNTNIDSYFLSMSINRSQAYFSKRGAGTKVQNISKPNVENFEFYCPSEREQQKIGSFFKQLDETIALHQRKCEQTKELKKTMLQKMFSKKGERIPEIRFPEFTDEWEEKKLGEVVEREIKGKAKANMQGTKSIYLETEYLNGGETTFVDSDADIEEDDILILWDGSQAGTVYHGFFGALGSTLKAYRPKESGKFVYYQLVAHQEMIFQRYRTPNIPHVIKTFTDEFSVFTTSLSEQERIGNFFKHLDTLIALHQSKCDSLKELKKTLLRQLFV